MIVDGRMGSVLFVQVDYLADSIKQMEGYSIGIILQYDYLEPE
jgi:hypothetical protein